MEIDQPVVVSVSRDGEHRFSKVVTDEVTLLSGLGVQGDAHAGTTVQHRSRVAADRPSRTCARCSSSTQSCTPSYASRASTSHPASSGRTSPPPG